MFCGGYEKWTKAIGFRTSGGAVLRCASGAAPTISLVTFPTRGMPGCLPGRAPLSERRPSKDRQYQWGSARQPQSPLRSYRLTHLYPDADDPSCRWWEPARIRSRHRDRSVAHGARHSHHAHDSVVRPRRSGETGHAGAGGGANQCRTGADGGQCGAGHALPNETGPTQRWPGPVREAGGKPGRNRPAAAACNAPGAGCRRAAIDRSRRDCHGAVTSCACAGATCSGRRGGAASGTPAIARIRQR